MARKHVSGGEIDLSQASGVPPDGTTSGTVTRDTSVFRSGIASVKFDSTGSNVTANLQLLDQTGSALIAASNTYFVRAYLNFTSLPGSTARVVEVGVGGVGAANGVSARLTSAGKLQLFNNATGVQVGSDSSATIAAGSTWYRVEVEVVTNASNQVTACELRLDGVSVASTTGLTLTGGSGVRVGWCTAPGVSLVMNGDDFAVNNAAGAVNNTWPGSGKVVLLRPVSLNANGGSWTDDNAATTSAALTNALDNTPPKGIADTTAGGGDHQVRNAGANTSLDMNLTAYATAGVSGGDTINAVLPVTNVGAPVSTGAKTGSVGVVSNPAITNIAFVAGGTADFWQGAAAGTFPSNWSWNYGTLTEAPTVTVGTSPVARVTITGGTTSRVAMVDALLLYVDYTPAAPLPFQGSEGELHADPRSLQILDRIGVTRGSFFCLGDKRRPSGGLAPA